MQWRKKKRIRIKNDRGKKERNRIILSENRFIMEDEDYEGNRLVICVFFPKGMQLEKKQV